MLSATGQPGQHTIWTGSWPCTPRTRCSICTETLRPRWDRLRRAKRSRRRWSNGRETTEEWQALSRRISEKLGDADYYRLIFDPYQADPPVTASLADDVADIYRDLRGGFALLEPGGMRDGAVWEWRFGFDSHWGRHAAHALYAVRVLTRG